jgi:hypothetical protein
MKRVLPVVAALLAFSPCAGAAQNKDTAAIKAFIARQARSERGAEYPDARMVLAGDLNRDGIPDIAVLYTIEGMLGSNNYVQYLAVFIRRRGKIVPVAHAQVGGKSYRDVELSSISENSLELQTMDYAPNDAMCCPSRKGKTRYALVGRILREM